MITGFYAAILALLYLGLTYFVILGRFRHRVPLGDGGNDNMQKRIRIHANFAEFVPFALLLLMLAEMQAAPLWSIHAAGILLIAARLLHVAGMLAKKVSNPARLLGTVLTHLVMLFAALWGIGAAFSQWL